MSHLKLILWCTLIITFYGLTSGVEDTQENNNNEAIPKAINKTVEDVRKNLTNARTGRILVYPPRAPAFTLRRRQPIKIRSRSDHFPLRTQIRRVYNGVANVQQPQPLRYGYESLKSSKYMPASKGANTQFLNNGKGGGGTHRQQLMGVHPNSVQVPALSQQYIHNFKASPTFNGNVVVHPAGQQQQQQQQQPLQDNGYPKYVKPQQQAAIKLQQQSQYPDLKQFPIPDQDQMQKYNQQHEKYLQQQKYLTPRDPLAYYQQQPQQNYEVQQSQYNAQKPIISQPQLQQQPSIPIHAITSETAGTANINNIAFPSTAKPQKMYSVYEDNDMTELQNNNYQTASYQGLDKEAQEYLRFMKTNEYFLPKKDPNYKLLDEENERRQFKNIKPQQLQPQLTIQQQKPLQPYAQSLYKKQEQQQTPYQQPQHHAAPYQQPQPQSQALQQRPEEQQQKLYQPQQAQLYSNNRYSDTSGASTYNQPIQVSKLFYDYNQDEAKPSSSPASATVVNTSYQTGYNQNQFLVNSQDNKVSKYNVAPSQSNTAVSTPSPIQTNNLYAQVQQNSQSSRTPEPLRFEFTERDAMVGGVSYTHAPQGQLRYKAVDTYATPTVESSTTSSTGATLSTSLSAQTYHHNHAVKPVRELDDDLEDGDDTQEGGQNLYGRQPAVNRNSNINQQASTTETPPSEQKDTEEYCERICAIVEDEHEEIICGSDGYMYTSEAQMECYASCLHIDVTIQGKGSCSSR